MNLTNKYYILVDRVPRECHDIEEWGNWMDKRNERRVDSTKIGKSIRVSTVFLGLDHQWGDGTPLRLFETMIFGGPHSEFQERYSTWDEAVEGHKRAVAMVKEDFNEI